ncbi:MAG: helix-turn-helix domain-containing protein [Anaerolineae bacterium]
MQWVRTGEAGSVVSLLGGGKTTFVHFLLRDDVRRHHLGPTSDNYQFLLVDFYPLSSSAGWAGFELILRRLLEQGEKIDLNVGSRDELRAQHQEILRTHNLSLAQNALERSIALACRDSAKRLVLLFDNFDHVFAEVEASFFLSLRAMRNINQGRLIYLIFTFNELPRLRPALSEVDPFYRLFVRNVCGLGPYNEAEARFMLAELANISGVELDEPAIKRLLQITGGHAGLLKTAFQTWAQGRLALTDASPTTLLREPAAWSECQNIWNSLGADEQLALQQLVAAPTPSLVPSVSRALTLKGLWRNGEITLPVLKVFIQRLAVNHIPKPTVDRQRRRIQWGAKLLTDLTPLEFEVLAYLIEHTDQVCTRDDLIQHLYAEQVADPQVGVSDNRINTLIYRLRQKIEVDPRHPRFVLTVQGQGYRLGSGGAD